MVHAILNHNVYGESQLRENVAATDPSLSTENSTGSRDRPPVNRERTQYDGAEGSS